MTLSKRQFSGVVKKKTLHIVDKDGFLEGSSDLCSILEAIVKSVDIPIQVGGGLRDAAQIRELFRMGVFRVVVGTALVEHPELIEQFLKEFGSRKIAVAIESSDGRIIIDGRKKLTDVDPIEHALRMKKLGVSRIVFYSIHPETKEEIFDFEALKKMARKTMVRITSGGGISNYKELIKAQELEKYGVDSVIIGKALYENNFPCQRLWRLNEKLLTELGPTRRI